MTWSIVQKARMSWQTACHVFPLHTINTAEDAEQHLITEIAETFPLLTAIPLVDFKAEC